MGPNDSDEIDWEKFDQEMDKLGDDATDWMSMMPPATEDYGDDCPEAYSKP